MPETVRRSCVNHAHRSQAYTHSCCVAYVCGVSVFRTQDTATTKYGELPIVAPDNLQLVE
jgi:hypothetical protein